MTPSFTKKNFFKHVYSVVDEKSDPYDELTSVKALFDEESSEFSSTETLLAKREQTHSRRYHGVFFAFNIAIFCLSMTLFLVTFFKLAEPQDPMHNEALRKTSEHSPIFDQIHIPLVETTRNGSFTSPAHPSIYRQDPSPEVDEAWNRISNINTIPLSSADVHKRGVDPATTAKYPASFGLGDDAHIGRLDVFHQIHCLNALRKEISFQHYYGGKFVDDIPTPSHKAHVSHCLDIILQTLKCSATVDPILHYWVDISETPFPNFNDRHVCRDFDRILEWQEENSVDGRHFTETMVRPEGVRVHHMSKAYKAALALNQVAQNHPDEH